MSTRSASAPLTLSTGIAATLLTTAAAMLAPQRAVAAPNLYVIGLDSGAVREYTTGGTLVGSPFTVPTAPGGDSSRRDLVVDSTGRLHVYNGTFDPFLSTRPAGGGAFAHRTHPGWSTVNNISYGGIGTAGNYVFATDMQTFGGGGDEANGIVRFNFADNTATRFATGIEFIDLNVGLDGLLYGLHPGGSPEGRFIDVYDPNTLTFIRQIPLGFSNPQRGISVNAAGNIFAVDWNGAINRFSPTGALLGSTPTGVSNLTDIDVHPDGTLIAGSRFGTVIVGSTGSTAFTTFPTPAGETIFVTFTDPVPEPATAAATLVVMTLIARRRGRRQVRSV